MTTLKDTIRDIITEYDADYDHAWDNEDLTQAICDETEEFIRKALGN